MWVKVVCVLQCFMEYVATHKLNNAVCTVLYCPLELFEQTDLVVLISSGKGYFFLLLCHLYKNALIQLQYLFNKLVLYCTASLSV